MFACGDYIESSQSSGSSCPLSVGKRWKIVRDDLDERKVSRQLQESQEWKQGQQALNKKTKAVIGKKKVTLNEVAEFVKWKLISQETANNLERYLSEWLQSRFLVEKVKTKQTEKIIVNLLETTDPWLKFSPPRGSDPFGGLKAAFRADNKGFLRWFKNISSFKVCEIMGMDMMPETDGVPKYDDTVVNKETYDKKGKPTGTLLLRYVASGVDMMLMSLMKETINKMQIDKKIVEADYYQKYDDEMADKVDQKKIEIIEVKETEYAAQVSVNIKRREYREQIRLSLAEFVDNFETYWSNLKRFGCLDNAHDIIDDDIRKSRFDAMNEGVEELKGKCKENIEFIEAEKEAIKKKYEMK